MDLRALLIALRLTFEINLQCHNGASSPLGSMSTVNWKILARFVSKNVWQAKIHVCKLVYKLV